MKTKLIIPIICILLTSILMGQQRPAFKEVIDSLALPGSESEIILPVNYFTQPDTTSVGKMQRGGVLLAAAGRAREINNADRALILADAAKTWLTGALAGLGGDNAAASQCQYHLGMIAEQYEGDLATAESRYQTAVGLSASNTQAQQALARVQFVRNPPSREPILKTAPL